MTRWMPFALCLVCALPAAAADAPAVIERVVAVVEDRVITLSEVDEQAEAELKMLPAEDRDAKRAAVRKEVLDHMIDEALVEHQRTLYPDRLKVEDKEIDLAVEQVLKDNKLNEDQLKEALQRQGMTWPAYRDNIRTQLERVKIMQNFVRAKVQISDREVQQAYQEQLAASKDDLEVRVRHILFYLPPDAAPEAVTEGKAKADATVRELADGADFAELAKQRSDDPSGKTRGGDLGFQTLDSLLPEFGKAVRHLKVGEVSPPVRTRLGWHVVQLTNQKAHDAPPFEQVEAQLRNQLYQRAMQRELENWLAELRKSSYVEIKKW